MMKSTQLYFLVAAVFIFGAADTIYSQPDVKEGAPSRQRDLREIEQLEIEWNRINEVSDADGKQRLLAEDSYHIGPSGRHYNKAQDVATTADSYRQKEASGSKVQFIMTNQKIRLYKNVAVVTATGTSITTRDGQQRRGSSFRAIHVWERRDGRWQLVVDQVTGVATQR